MRRLFAWLAPCLLFCLPTQAQTPIGDPFRIDTTDVAQDRGLVTGGDASGRTVAVWAGSEGSDRSLYARAFSPDGQPEGPPLRLYPGLGGDAASPGLAVAPDGSFVVIWRHVPDNGFAAIYLGKFKADLSPDGAFVDLTDGQLSLYDNPSVAFLNNGDLYAVWDHLSHFPNSTISEIRGRLLDSDGQPRNRIIQISNAAGSSNVEPSLAVGRDGGVLFTWRSVAPAFGFDYLMRYRNPQGLLDEFSRRVNPDHHIGVANVRVAATRDGYLTLWTAKQEGIAVPPETLAFYRRFDLATVPLDEARAFPFVETADQVELAVGPTADGGLVTSRALQYPPVPISPLPSSEIRALFFNSAGEPVGDDLVVTQSFRGLHDNLAASSTSGRRFILGWRELTAQPIGPDQEDLWGQIVQAPGGCFGNDETLCLNGDRFQVRANWRRPDGLQGRATARTLTDETGFFYFQEAGNIEMVVKVLDACSFADHFWVFAAGLTNLEVELEVVDTLFAETRTYRNPLDQPFTPIQDTTAFDTCP